jgi:hypothetical protein
MKTKVFTVIFLFAALLVLPQEILATHTETHCVQVYGGGSVCGAKAPEVVHEPVKADVGDINLGLFGLSMLAISGTLYFSSRKFTHNQKVSKGGER